MNRRQRIRRRAFLLALVGVLAVWGVVSSVQAKKYKTLVSVSQQRALTQIGEYMDSIETALLKAAYAATPGMLGRLSDDLQSLSLGAKTGLAALSSGDTALFHVNKFLSQVGEYTDALGQKLARGETVTAEERQRLGELLDTARSLSAQFGYMTDLMDAGTFSFDEIKKELRAAGETADTVSYWNAAADAEDSLKDFPTLIYDGPYSDHITEKTSALLAASAPVTSAEALKKAAEALGVKQNLLVSVGATAGRLPTYDFYKDGARVSVTVNGGYPAYILSDYVAGEARINMNEALETAAEYLRKIGYTNMAPTYSMCENGVCIANFAFMEGEYICYPDLIKVGVSLSDGAVVSMDARDYIMNHVSRRIPEETVAKEAAVEAAADTLRVERVSRAVIPTGGGYEKFAWELKCADAGGQDVLVYIDTSTGQEDDILILLYADGGALTK